MALLMGTVLGFLTGLGVGGGSLLILWLTLGLGMEQEIATGINLLFFLPSALICTLFRHKQGTLPFKKVLPATICACIAAGLFTVISRNMDTEFLKKLFGGVLLITGIKELCYRPRKAK